MFLLWLFKVSGILRFSTWSLNEALPWGLWEFCSHEKSTDIIASRKTEKLGIYCLEVYQIYWFPWNDCSCSAGGDLEAPGGWIVPSSCGRYSWSEIQMCPEAVGWCCCGGHPSFRKLPPGRPILPRLCRCSLVLLKYFTCVVFFLSGWNSIWGNKVPVWSSSQAICRKDAKYRGLGWDLDLNEGSHVFGG